MDQGTPTWHGVPLKYVSLVTVIPAYFLAFLTLLVDCAKLCSHSRIHRLWRSPLFNLTDNALLANNARREWSAIFHFHRRLPQRNPQTHHLRRRRHTRQEPRKHTLVPPIPLGRNLWQ